MEAVDNYVGVGIKTPNMFNKISGGIDTNTGQDRINQSIRQILSTPVGTRFFLPSFGSRIFEALFEPNDLIFQDLVTLYIKEALSLWEKRINVISITVGDNQGGDMNYTPVNILYNIVNTNITGSYVYPLNRGSYDIGGGGYGNY